MGETGLLENFLHGFAKPEAIVSVVLFFFFLNDGKPFLTVVGSSPSCDMSELSTALHSEAAWLHAASFRQACRRQCCNFSRKGGWKESPGCNVL